MITFRRVEEADFGLLGRWLADPAVHRWWQHDSTPAGVAGDFGPGVRGEEPGEDWVACLDGVPVGLVQRCRWDDYPDEHDALHPQVPLPPGALTLDYLLGVRRGEGLGVRTVAAMADRSWADHPDAPAIVVPVAAGNIASWRTLASAGFRLVGTAHLDAENPADPTDHVVYRIDRPA